MKYPQYIVLRYGSEVFRSSTWTIAHAWAGHDRERWGADKVKIVTRTKPSKADLIKSLDKFTQHYIIAALWSSNDESTPSGGEPLDRNYSIEDMTIACLETMKADCKRFQEENARALDLANRHKNTSYEIGGHDFWLTRNHHGAGFWDRGLRLHLGRHLTNKAHEYGEATLYVQRGKVGIE